MAHHSLFGYRAPFAAAVLAAVVLWPGAAAAAGHSGIVKAADQPVPGAAVTARQGGAAVTAYTDEAGRYTLELTPGIWEIEVVMFGFTSARKEVRAGGESTFLNWALEMPRYGEAAAEAKPAAAQSPAPPPAAKPTASNGRIGSRRGGPPPSRPGLQSAAVHATAEGEQARAAEPEAFHEITGEEAEDAFLVSGSTSGGLAASSEEEAFRQRMHSPHGEGGPGGPFGGPGMGAPPGMRGMEGDLLGLGGFGASALNAGFGEGPERAGFGGGSGFGAGGPGSEGRSGLGGPGGPGGGRGGPGGISSGRSGGGRGGPGGSSSRGPSGRRSSGSSRRGPYSGQYGSFGNRRRVEPRYTGSLFTYLNNSALNAAPYSLNGQEAKKPSYAQSRFGLSIGGPLSIPKLVEWPRASFYFTYQGSRSRNPYSHLSTVPSAAEREGDFSQARANTPVAIFDPLTKQPFPNNVIPASRIDRAAAGLLSFFPLPTYGVPVQNYQIVTSTPNGSDNYGVRLNLPLSRKDRLTFNVQFQTRDAENAQLFGFRDSSTGGGMSSSIGWSHSFRPRLNNSANLSLSRNRNTNAPYFAYTRNIAAELGIAGTSQDPINWGPPNLSFTNFGSLSDGSASVLRNQTVSFSDSVTFVVKRSHNLAVGFSYRRMQNNSLTYQNARGAFTFSGLLTSAIDANGQPRARTGFDFADFLLGLPQSSSLRYGSDNNYFRGSSRNWYARDDFRLNSRLSLNFGLRYEYFSPYRELHGRLANLDVKPDWTAVAVVTPGMRAPFSGDLPASLVRPDSNNFSPRFGFAWRPGKRRGMVVRGGYSIFYNGSAYPQMASQMASQPPFARTSSISTSPAYPLTLADGFPIVASQIITNTYAVSPDQRPAYAQNWMLAVQSSLPHGLLAEIEYIGTKGTNLGIVTQPNRAAPGSPLTAQDRLRIPYATGFNYQTVGANSSFNAGQVRITRRFQRGMAGSAQYAYSKAIDNASSYAGTGGTVVQFPEDLHLERGLSTFDQRHRLSANWMLSSPVGVRGLWRDGGVKTKLFTNWALTGNFSATSGTPLTARVAGNLSNTGGIAAFGAGRAQASGLAIDEGGYPYFNLLAFTTPPGGQYGNAGRNTIPGLFRTSFNTSLNRTFRFGDGRRHLQLRLSANNVLNHVVITSVGTTVNSSTYGLPVGASSTRTVNLLLRLAF